MDPMHAQFTRRYNIPLDHLDFKYISTCSDVRELENIYKVLLSGEEGRYPELEVHCEARLSSLAPNSRVLRKDQPPLHPSSLDRGEWNDIAADLNAWSASVSSGQEERTAAAPPVEEDALPPVRATNATISLTAAPAPAATAGASTSGVKQLQQQRRPMPRSYDEWARLEKQLEQEPDDDDDGGKAAKKSQQQKPPTPPAASAPPRRNHAQSLPSRLPVDGLPAEERLRLAEAEKAKGNEAFRSSDFDEAVVYYTRSVSACPLPAAYNNRAFAYLKLQKYTACVKDCGRVLKSEPDNAKALLRRATANHRIHRSGDARADLQRLLRLEPGNSAAATMLTEVEALLAKRAQPAAGAKRMVIEEVGSEDEEEEDAAAADPVVGAPNGGTSGAQKVPVTQRSPYDLPKDTQSEKRPDLPMDTKSQRSSDDLPKGPQSEKRLEPPKDTKSQRSPYDLPKGPQSEKRLEPPKDTKSSKAADPEAATNGGRPAAKPKVPAADEAHEAVAQPEAEFESAKEEGTRLFKAGNYARAMELYDRCTAIRPGDPVPYTNRAVCCIKLDRPNDAVYECNMALEADPHNMKAIFRRGVARKMLGFYRESLMDLNLAKSFDPLNKQIGREIAEVEAALCGSSGRRVLVQEVEDEEEEELEDEGLDAEPVPVIRDVDGIVTELLSPAGKRAPLFDRPETTTRSASDKIERPADKAAPIDYRAESLASNIESVTGNRSPADIFAAESASDKDMADADQNAAGSAKVTPVADQNTAASDKVAPFADKNAAASDKVTPVADKDSAASDKVTPVADKNAAASDKVTPIADWNVVASDKVTPVADKDAAASDKVTPIADKNAAASDKAMPSSRGKPATPAPAADSLHLDFPSPAADRPVLRSDCSPFEFTQAWLSTARGPVDSQRSARADLLSAVDPARLPKLLSNKLDGPLLQQVVGAVAHCLLDRDAPRATRVLLSLPAADRFHVVAMFLDGSDKSELSTILSKLESAGAASSDELRQLRSAYQLG